MPGIGCFRLALAAMTMSISSGSSPLAAIALPPAATAISTRVSSSPAQRPSATTTRQPRKLPRSTTPGRQELARAVEVGRAGDGEDLGVAALPLALGQAGQRAGGRELDGGGDAEVAHGGQAGVEADRAGDLADQ